MRKIALFVIGLFAMCSMTSCSLHLTKRDRVTFYKVSDIKDVELSGNLTVKFVKGSEAQVKVEGLRDEVESIVVSQVGNKLIVRNKKAIEKLRVELGEEKLIVFISAPNLRSLNAKGSVMVTCDDPVQTDSLKVYARGQSVVSLNLKNVENSYFNVSTNSGLTANYDSCNYSKIVVNDNCFGIIKGTLYKRIDMKSGDNAVVVNVVEYIN